ncbi:MAG: hypothetical protein QW273_02970 [Candidatus Pacearchaeota archaeon]
MRILIFDAGPLISLTLSGILEILEKLHSFLKETSFVITPQVKREIVDRTFLIKKYSLEAFKIQRLIDKKILLLSTEFVKNSDLNLELSKVLSLSKNLLKADNEKISLLHEGESSCIAFSKLVKFPSLIVTDERNVRLITESKEALKELSERKLHTTLKLNKKNFKYFEDLKYVRSSELVFFAFKNNLFEIEKSPEALEALLYNLKFHGTAISSKEIEEMKNLLFS